MNSLSCASLICVVLVINLFIAQTEAIADSELSPVPELTSLSNPSMSADMRWNIKRQVMSNNEVLLDMASMIDSGYSWTNDVVWNGTDHSGDNSWHTAGFYFERPGYVGVWLQYAFTLGEPANKVQHVKRLYGVGSFR